MSRCGKCGRFCQSRAFAGEGSQELVWVTCSIHGSWAEES